MPLETESSPIYDELPPLRFDSTAWRMWRASLLITALVLCIAATCFAAYGWYRHLPAVPECDSRYYEPFLGSLQRSDDALHTSLALATAALVVSVAALIQAIAVFRTGIFRWVLIVTFVVLGLPIVIVLNVLKDFQAPNCF